jgi:PAS domain S-box-containing protein
MHTNKILLIEDNPGDARLVEILLSESDLLDCEIYHRVSLAEAMMELEKNTDFEAILLDLTLPDSQGFETLAQLITKFPNNNVIVLTGLADKSLGLKAVKAGAQDFLVKGAFDSELLAKTLRFSIERNQVLKRLEETQRVAHIGNWEYQPESNYFIASDEVYRIFGLPPRETFFLGQDLEDPKCPFHFFYQINRDVLDVGELKKDLKVTQANGSSKYVYIQCTVRKSQEYGEVIHGIIQDITERKLSEQELLKSQERYEEIFTESKDAIFIATLEGKLVDFNNATTELFGYPKRELESQNNIHELFYPREKKNEFLLKLRTQKSIKEYSIKVAHKSGEVRHCVISANIFVADDFIGYNCILRDITERKQAEKMKKARDLARHSAMMKEQFIASVSHEMRTPMNAILGMSNILVQMDLEKEQFNLVSSIKQSSEILLGVVNDILEISAIQNGKIVFENKFFNLEELLANLVNVMQYKAQEKDLYFETIIDEETPMILLGDKLRLNQILYNLVGNAIKFTDHGFIKIYIKKLFDIVDSVQLQFIVEDSGIGIPSEKIDAIFETFTRIRQKDRLYEGTGLGLSICKNLVEQQGGKIGATSEEGKDSKFFFDLIFEVGEASQLEPKSPELDHVELDEETPFRLLLVEDHKMNQLVARKTLERKFPNIYLKIADNGKIAIDILEQESFDIILMDIQMPVMDGYEATKHIREEMPDSIATLPILAMTAHAHISKDEKFKEYGLDDYVLKPFEPEDLFNKIAKYLRK